MSTPSYILVGDVVYMQCRAWTGAPIWMRMSVPYDPKSKAPLSYPGTRPPAGEAVGEERATELIKASKVAWAERLKAQGKRVTA